MNIVRHQCQTSRHGPMSTAAVTPRNVRVATAQLDPVTISTDELGMDARRQALANLYASPGAEEPETYLLTPAQEAPPPVPPPQVGDIVYGTVTFSNNKGARVQLMGYDNLIGFMPEYYNPVELPFTTPAKPQYRVHQDISQQPRTPAATKPEQDPVSATAEATTGSTSMQATTGGEAVQDAQQDATGGAQKRKQPAKKRKGKGDEQINENAWMMPVGTVRPFLVVAVNAGKSPLLSAHAADHQVMVTRMAQLQELCNEDKRTVRATVVGYNNGGCMCSILGLYGQAFMPFGFLQYSPQDGTRWTRGNAHLLMGCELDVAFVEVDAVKHKVVVSERAGTEMHAARVLQLGNAVAGVVQQVFSWGMDVRLHAVPGAYAQVQRERITRAPRPPAPTSMFRVGDEVVGLLSYVHGRGANQQLQMSLMELEEQDGDMLTSATRAMCFERAASYTTH